jgi:hypothetical protein
VACQGLVGALKSLSRTNPPCAQVACQGSVGALKSLYQCNDTEAKRTAVGVFGNLRSFLHFFLAGLSCRNVSNGALSVAPIRQSVAPCNLSARGGVAREMN